MSTILRSLKKLEQQKEARQYTGPIAGYRGPGSVGLHGAKHSWFKSAWFRRSLVAAIILSLGASSLYFYNQSQDVHHEARTDNAPPLTARNTVKRPQQQKQSVSQGDRDAKAIVRKPPIRRQKPIKKAQPTEIAKRPPTTQRKVQSPPISNTPRTEPRTAERRASTSRMEEGATSAQRAVRKSTETNPSQRAKTAGPAPIRNDTKSTPSPQRQVGATPVKRKPAKAPADSYQNVASLTDGRLKVQAIVWSRIPEDRMTVINSRVLHEGDAVDGFTLLTIRSDDVVVKEDSGARWKVLFGRP